jgi:hypothetical protein
LDVDFDAVNVCTQLEIISEEERISSLNCRFKLYSVWQDQNTSQFISTFFRTTCQHHDLALQVSKMPATIHPALLCDDLSPLMQADLEAASAEWQGEWTHHDQSNFELELGQSIQFGGWVIDNGQA